ncbi:MAG TPA: FAD-binding oxidoreductase [Streptosporangiaceae bacterium]
MIKLNTTEQVLTGWGRTAPSRAVVAAPADLTQLQEIIAAQPARGLVARGAGRSYGDAAQNGGGYILHPVTSPHFELDVAAATVRASASTTFTALLEQLVPHGLLLPVLPGTRHLTVGGAVAADVHGKNQHGDGSISAWIDEIDLVDGDSKRRTLLPGTDGFRATVGGMGLTGVILEVKFRLFRISSTALQVTTRRLPDLDSLLAAMDASSSRYSVAWIDTTASRRSFGRGVLDTGDHLAQPGPADRDGLAYRAGRPPLAPELPFCPFTPVTARAFNGLWYRAAARELTGTVSLARYFHRLDAVSQWNRALGPRGFLQYQFMVPQNADTIITEVLTALRRHRGAPFLGTLKRFGPSSENYLSFPGPGWSLAVDLPAGNRRLRTVLDHLDRRVADVGGRVYLAKDARLRPDTFANMYRQIEAWRTARQRLDPRGVFCSDLGRRLGLC